MNVEIRPLELIEESLQKILQTLQNKYTEKKGLAI